MDAIKHGWMEYKQQPVLPASLAYVLLYFNVVLTPSGIMTAFLTQRGMLLTIPVIHDILAIEISFAIAPHKYQYSSRIMQKT